MTFKQFIVRLLKSFKYDGSLKERQRQFKIDFELVEQTVQFHLKNNNKLPLDVAPAGEVETKKGIKFVRVSYINEDWLKFTNKRLKHIYSKESLNVELIKREDKMRLLIDTL